MNTLSIIQISLVFIVIIFVHVHWAKHRIKQWALRNNFVITKCKICLTNLGPFSYFGTSGGQSIFRIEAVTTDGKTRTGYARAGGFFFGLLRQRVEVKWDKSLLDEQLHNNDINLMP